MLPGFEGEPDERLDAVRAGSRNLRVECPALGLATKEPAGAGETESPARFINCVFSVIMGEVRAGAFGHGRSPEVDHDFAKVLAALEALKCALCVF